MSNLNKADKKAKHVSIGMLVVGVVLLIIALVMATSNVTAPNPSENLLGQNTGMDYDCGSVLSPKSSGALGQAADYLSGLFGGGGVSKDSACDGPIGGQRTIAIALTVLGIILAGIGGMILRAALGEEKIIAEKKVHATKHDE